jgi:hypothetical protein
MSVNGFYDLKLFSHMKQHSYRAMTITFNSLGYAFGEPFEKILGTPQVSQYNWSGFAINPPGFNDAPVGFAPGFPFLQGSHISVYINLFSHLCQVFFCFKKAFKYQ